MLAVMVLSQHQIFSSKTVRPCYPCGCRCMEHVIRTWSAVCLIAPHSQFDEIVQDEKIPFVRGQMKSPKTSPGAIELNSSCSGQAHSNRLDTSHKYENTEPRCTLTVFCVPSIIRSLKSADA